MDSDKNIHKKIFAQNLKKWLMITGKTQSDIVTDLNITASTVSDWCLGKKYPRVDKIQALADYFGILKSDLTEEVSDSEDELSFIKNRIMHSLHDKPEDFLKNVKNYIDFISRSNQQ